MGTSIYEIDERGDYVRDERGHKMSRQKACRECGKVFRIVRAWQEFCSDGCRFDNYVAKKRKVRADNPPL